jgi:hypothetical protein
MLEKYPKNMKYVFTFFILFSFNFFLSAQMWNGQDTLYGNEWIDYDQSYLKIEVAEDGIYKIPYGLIQNEIPSNIEGKHFQLYYLGQEVPIYTSNEGTLSTDDFIEFFGRKNRSELDQYLFSNPSEELLNPDFSMFTDTSAYFLTWNDESIQNERYDEVQNNIAGLTQPEPFFLYESNNIYADESIKKTVNFSGANVSTSTFDEGQGYSSPLTQHQTFTLNLPQFFPQGVNEIPLNIRTYGQAIGSFQDSITLNGEEVLRLDYVGNELNDHTLMLPIDQFSEINTISVAGLKASSGNSSRVSVSKINVTYPRTFDFENSNSFRFKIAASSTIKYLEIQNFNSGDNPILYDLTNSFRLEATVESGIVKVALPPSPTLRELILVNGNELNQVGDFEDTNFINYWEVEGNFIMISHPALFDDGSGKNWVQNYADYRRSTAGGNYESIIVDINQLYEQFSYGVKRHSISIRNFGHFIKKNWSNPKYVFLVGKARQYPDVRSKDQLADQYLKNFFLPTFGTPGGDNLLLATPGTRYPIIPIGRLAVTTGKHVEIYYNKVVEFESTKNLPQTLTDKGWMKNILHLGGGGIGDQQSIKNHLNIFENTIENSDFAANVTSFFKTSSDPIQGPQSESLFRVINGGTSIITFFGHSNPNGFDFQVDSPQSYNNKAKYPLMFSFGCFSGQCHLDGTGVGERFVLAEESGAIAYIASSGYGFISSLGTFGNDYYGKIGNSMYGAGIGDVLQSTLTQLSPSGWIGDRTLASQSTLQGDPSLRLNAHEGSDFLVDVSTVSHEPSLINLQSEDIILNFDIHNIGKGNKDSFELKINQELPTGELVNLMIDQVNVPYFKESFSYKIPTINQPDVVGQNYYHISIDSDESIDELPNPNAESNNDLVNASGRKGFPVLILSNDLVPIYPRDFSIVDNPDLTLTATTADVFAPEQVFYFEIDSTENFDSDFKQRLEVVGSGGVLKWKPNISYENEKVYYWRVSPDSTSADVGYRWYNSSFVFLEDAEDGWNQSHFYQFKSDIFNNKTLEEPFRELKYIEDYKEIHIQNREMINFGGGKPRFLVNGDDILHWNPQISAGAYVIILDGLTVDPWYDPQNGTPNANAYGDDGYGKGSFPFLTSNKNHRKELISFLSDTIPSGSYVLFYTFQKPNTTYKPEEWAADSVNLGTNLFQVLENQGAELIRGVEDGSVPYVFFFKKDDPLYQPLERITEKDGIILEDINVAGIWDSGDLTSVRIGPVASWNKFQFELNDFNSDEEEAYFDIYGINSNTDQEVLLKAQVQNTETDLSDINSLAYPYLKLVYRSKDEINRTPPQLDYWRILYEDLPEAALNPMAFFELEKDTFQQGEILTMRIAVENIGQLDMDSLLVNFRIIDTQNGEEIDSVRLSPLLTGDTLIAVLDFDTQTISGAYTIVIDANPNNDQPELTHQNNIGVINFFVKSDRRNPLLDVTFDGLHIMEGDIVSPKTEIIIELKDENPYLALSDTSSFQVWLQYPDESSPRLIPFNGEFMEFFPANSNNLAEENKARIELKPDLFKDGIYKLRIQAQDASGNVSGNIDYNISFEVISKAMISNVLNYPNPFSTSTQFVYTLTGVEVPAYYKIQIMTVSGRIIREIDQTELGELRIGTHKTDFAWDGTDQFGDRLANGVYLYRFVTKNSDGSDYENFQRDSVDKFFQKGFGKMVLLK